MTRRIVRFLTRLVAWLVTDEEAWQAFDELPRYETDPEEI